MFMFFDLRWIAQNKLLFYDLSHFHTQTEPANEHKKLSSAVLYKNYERQFKLWKTVYLWKSITSYLYSRYTQSRRRSFTIWYTKDLKMYIVAFVVFNTSFSPFLSALLFSIILPNLCFYFLFYVTFELFKRILFYKHS